MLLVACLLVWVGGWTEPHNTQNEWKRMDKTRDAWICETSHTHTKGESATQNKIHQGAQTPTLNSYFFCFLLTLTFVLLSESWIPKDSSHGKMGRYLPWDLSADACCFDLICDLWPGQLARWNQVHRGEGRILESCGWKSLLPEVWTQFRKIE